METIVGCMRCRSFSIFQPRSAGTDGGTNTGTGAAGKADSAKWGYYIGIGKGRIRPRLVFDWYRADRPFFPHGPRMRDSGTGEKILRCEAKGMSVADRGRSSRRGMLG